VIRAIIFDMDGTLVRTEHLKMLSYSQALDLLDPSTEHLRQAAEAFRDVVGLSREDVADHLLERMGLCEVAARRADELGLAAPRDALLSERVQIYLDMVQGPGALRPYRTRETVDFLFASRDAGYLVALATGATCETASKVLTSIDLADCFDAIISGYDVPHNKPAPDIYLLAGERLKARPHECLAIEDSQVGVRSAVSAGLRCIAVTTAYTSKGVHECGLIDDEWIVDDPADVPAVARRMLAEG
jgi:beta-phosphoglucomutase-like phosphatase (HAD superfamily)